MAETCIFIWQSSRQLHSCSSDISENGSKFERIVPENMVGFWGIIPTFFRNSCNGRVEISTPPIDMGPGAPGEYTGSTRRSSESVSEDFPEPVRPTTPTRSPLWIANVTLLSTSWV